MQVSRNRPKKRCSQISRRFHHFCSKTSLLGWVYLTENPVNSWQTLLWAVVLVVVHVVAVVFIAIGSISFMEATVTTTVGTTAASLGDVFFPSVTVCNINQFQASLMHEMGVFNNLTQMTAIYNEYISGYEQLPDQAQIIKAIPWFKDKDLLYNQSISFYSHQPCQSMIVNLKFQNATLTWSEIADSLAVNPVGTDYGYCCVITPQLLSNVNAIEKGSKNGDSNGLLLTLDIENFNFAYHVASSQGLKVAVHDHRSKPIIGHEGILVEAGKLSLIGITPELTETTLAALEELQPEQRQCYGDDEVRLRYFPVEMGFHYDLNNCLFNYGLHRIINECRCNPSFLPNVTSNFGESTKRNPFCAGRQLQCMNMILGDIAGKDDRAFIVDEKDEHMSKTCLPKCSYQKNFLQVTTTIAPQSNNYFLQRKFCQVAKKLLSDGCLIGSKRIFLMAFHPNLCQMVEARSGFLKDCSAWPFPYLSDRIDDFLKIPPDEKAFIEAVQSYFYENVAEVDVAMKAPNVQTVKRDLAMTLTDFVGQIGGILGICIGFSFISVVEFFYHFILNR